MNIDSLRVQSKFSWETELRREDNPDTQYTISFRGTTPYLMPYGSTNLVNTLGVVAPYAEFKDQFSAISFSISGTQFFSPVIYDPDVTLSLLFGGKTYNNQTITPEEALIDSTAAIAGGVAGAVVLLVAVVVTIVIIHRRRKFFAQERTRIGDTMRGTAGQGKTESSTQLVPEKRVSKWRAGSVEQSTLVSVK